MILNDIINYCYKLYASKYIKPENSLDDVYKLAKDLHNIKGIENIKLSNPNKQTFINPYGKKVPYIDYKLNIDTKLGKIKGYIRLCKNESNIGYSIVLTLWEESINESFNLHGDLQMGKFLGMLKRCENFDDIKRTLKHFAKEGIVAGAMLSAVFMSFSLNPFERKDLIQSAYALEIQQNTDNQTLDMLRDALNDLNAANDEFDKVDKLSNSYNTENDKVYNKEDDNTPKWKLCCSNTEVTVYNACAAQCNANYSTTASGFQLNTNKPGAHKVVAMERTMMKQYGLHYGDLIKIEGTGKKDGIYQIQDTMNKRFAGRHKVDILVNNDEHLGKWHDVKIYKLVNQNDVLVNLKANMLNAKNQSKMDAKQYSQINESYDFNRLNFSLDNEDENEDDTLYSKSNNINRQLSYISFEIIKNLLMNPNSNENYVFVNDTYDNTMEDLLNFNIYDFYEDGHSILKKALLPEKNSRNIKANNKIKLNYCKIKHSLPFYRVAIDKKTNDMYFYIFSKWYYTKWLTINSNIINVLHRSNSKIIKFGQINGGTIKDPSFSIIENNISFFHNTDWNGNSYYLPKNLKPGTKLEKLFILTHSFVNNFCNSFLNESNGNDYTTLYTAMFESLNDFKDIVSFLVNKGYKIVDEYDITYDKDNLNKSFLQIDKERNEESINEKNEAINIFLTNQLTKEGILNYDDVKDKILLSKSNFYIKALYKYNRSQKNIYKKLNYKIVELFLKDNNIDIDSYIQNIKASYFSNKDKEHLALMPFYSVLNNKIIDDKPNKWQSDKDRMSILIFNKLKIKDYYNGGYTYRWYDFDMLPLAINDKVELYYFYKALGYALQNAYNNINKIVYYNGYNSKEYYEYIEKVNKDCIELDLNNIDFSAINKCLNTIFNDIVSK